MTQNLFILNIAGFPNDHNIISTFSENHSCTGNSGEMSILSSVKKKNVKFCFEGVN